MMKTTTALKIDELDGNLGTHDNVRLLQSWIRDHQSNYDTYI